MCGVIGFVASGKDAGVDIGLITELAILNEARRGGHAWGVSWLDRVGRLRSYKQPGAIDTGLLWVLIEDSTAVIIHTRYATHGSPQNNENNHPHPSDGGWLIHNGTLPDFKEVANSFATPPMTDCDSEALAKAWEDCAQNNHAKRADWMLRACQPSGPSPLVVLGLWKNEAIAVRQGNPLWALPTSEGKYLSSLQPEAKGKAKSKWAEVPNNTVTVWGLGKSVTEKPYSLPTRKQQHLSGWLFPK